MKFYAEIHHPYQDKVLWHYFLEAPDKKAASDAIGLRVAEEHADGFLLDTGGLYLLFIEEDTDPTPLSKNPRTRLIYDERLFPEAGRGTITERTPLDG